jgi:hypothetical protein
MRFPTGSLIPSGGDIYCHVFENKHTGLARNLFWSITITFEPIQYGDNEFQCSMTCEWITISLVRPDRLGSVPDFQRTHSR